MGAGDHSSAYLSDVVYTSQYNPLLNPLNIHYIAALKGQVSGPLGADFRYLDLGCGDASTLNLLASMYPDAHFTGIDFNEDHIKLARDVASRRELKNIEFHQLDFLKLREHRCENLDFITCFGTFSWIGNAAQESVAKFVSESLKPGGLFLVHYTASPGKVQIDPVWYLMRVITGNVAADSIERARHGIGTLKALNQGGAMFFKQNPLASQLVDLLDRQEISHWAHTGLTEWQALRHGDVSKRMADAGLTFLGHANPEQNDEDLSVPAHFHSMLSEFTDTRIRQTVIDYIVNRGARVDVYAKTGKAPESRPPAIENIPFGITTPDNAVSLTYKSLNGTQIRYDEPLYRAITAELQTGAKTPGDLLSSPGLDHSKPQDIVTAVCRLVAGKQVQPFARRTNRKQSGRPARVLPGNRSIAAILSSPVKIDKMVYLPHIESGQCIPLLPPHALVLSAILRAPPEGIADWVIGQLDLAGVWRDATANTTANPEQVRNIVMGHYETVNRTILPNLLDLGLLTPGE